MVFSNRYTILFIFAIYIIGSFGKKTCKDLSADPDNCTKFFRCFQNVRIRFTCANGTAWEDSLKTCIWKKHVAACKRVEQQQRKMDMADDIITYDADMDALSNITFGRTLSEARSLGPINTPKQYRCSYCNVGQCGIVVNTVQCFCGYVQCQQPTTTTTTPRNPCVPNPCLNGGQCVPLGGGFKCNCPATYTGNRCEAPAPTPCQPNPCQNGGTCIPQGTQYYCQCPPTHNGYCCENYITTTTPFNPCAMNPCQNGGTCIPQGTTFYCQCPPTHNGYCCETLITTTTPFNPCAMNPCQNGGTCIPQGTTFYCQCPPTHNGYCCENFITTTTPFNPCAMNPCQNGGTCIPQGTTFYCQCPPTHNGYCCETLITTTTPFNPCAMNPCQNGGQCIPTGNSFLCQCPAGYYGTQCENRNYCMPNPCANNGICTQTTTGFICSCTFPYNGPTCQQIITTTTTATTTTRAPCGNSCACVVVPCPVNVVTNPCSPNPCQNMGGCAVQNNAAKCWCPDGYQGYYCQHRRNARSLVSKTCNKTCFNGGQCYIDEQHGGQPQCSCPHEYYGSQCELINRPKSCFPKNPCMNDGKCITTSAGSQCICKSGTSGILCEKIERPNNQKYCPLDCQAGGVCLYVGASAKCQCTYGRTGRLCETRIA